MDEPSPSATLRRALAAVALCAAPAAAQFVEAPGKVPSGAFNASSTENVDLADVDLDGDWDAVFANGGDDGNDQNSIWINLGGAQGGVLGSFADETAQRFPAVSDDSRDVELVDYDGDGDLDFYSSNTAQLTPQSNRWWTNQGLAQGGAIGTFVDETVERWVGLGGPGSSVPNALVLATTGTLPGGFVDWSCDCDFADFDDDGDMDLFHSSYGLDFGSQTPSRVFLNDGQGFFSELNPAGYKPLGATLAEGKPALWAQGTYRANTVDTTGAEADIAGSALDVDMADADGDLDLDVFHGDRDEPPRFFANLLAETGGLAFRDTTHAVYPPSWAPWGGNYEQETADVDNDGDVDLFGLNWGSSLQDRLFRNSGGVFGDMTTLANSSNDANEADFVDFDNDGKVDLFVVGFASPNGVYKNVDTGSGPVGFELVQIVSSMDTPRGLDADGADVDGDGDTDVLVAGDSFDPNYLLSNETDVPDVFGPRLYRLEALPSGVASSGKRSVRVQVYDNAPYYVTWYQRVELEVSVQGCRIGKFPMRSSGGQIFRAELPANLLGPVEYRAKARDEYGNVGYSESRSYTNTDVVGGSKAIFGISSGLGSPVIRTLSVAYPGSTLYVAAEGMTPGNTWLLSWSQSPLVFPVVLPGLAIVNVGGIEYSSSSGIVDEYGWGVHGIELPATLPTASLYFQMFELPGDGVFLFDSSRGLRAETKP